MQPKYATEIWNQCKLIKPNATNQCKQTEICSQCQAAGGRAGGTNANFIKMVSGNPRKIQNYRCSIHGRCRPLDGHETLPQNVISVCPPGKYHSGNKQHMCFDQAFFICFYVFGCLDNHDVDEQLINLIKSFVKVKRTHLDTRWIIWATTSRTY